MSLCLSKECKRRICPGGKIDFLFRQITLVAQKGHLNLRAGLAACGINNSRSRKISNMEPVVAVAIPTVGTVANLNPIGAVLRYHDGSEAVLEQ